MNDIRPPLSTAWDTGLDFAASVHDSVHLLLSAFLHDEHSIGKGSRDALREFQAFPRLRTIGSHEAQLLDVREAKVMGATCCLAEQPAQGTALQGRMLPAERNEPEPVFPVLLRKHIRPKCCELLLETVAVHACQLSELAE